MTQFKIMNPIKNQGGCRDGSLFPALPGVQAAAFPTPSVLKAGRRALPQKGPSIWQHRTWWGALDPVLPVYLTPVSSPGSPQSEPVLGKPGPHSVGAPRGCFKVRPPPESEDPRPPLLKGVLNPKDIHGNIILENHLPGTI